MSFAGHKKKKKRLLNYYTIFGKIIIMSLRFVTKKLSILKKVKNENITFRNVAPQSRNANKKMNLYTFSKVLK